jgi:hypothetical protein
MMLGEHHNDVLSLAITAARSLSGPEIHGPTVEAVVTAITALARTSAELQKDGTNGDSCTCMPHLKLPCGHCPKQICEDCDRCACTCDCGTGGEA